MADQRHEAVAPFDRELGHCVRGLLVEQPRPGVVDHLIDLGPLGAQAGIRLHSLGFQRRRAHFALGPFDQQRLVDVAPLARDGDVDGRTLRRLPTLAERLLRLSDHGQRLGQAILQGGVGFLARIQDRRVRLAPALLQRHVRRQLSLR